MYLFVDTETTGKIDYSLPYNNPDRYPRLVEISWIMANNETVIYRGKSHIIKPDGFEIPKDATLIHGITTAEANEKGHDLYCVLNELISDFSLSDVIIAHNLFFDYQIIMNELVNKKLSIIFPCKLFGCTMLTGTKVCKIENDYGYKWPKLEELYYCLFGEMVNQEHRALSDAELCRKSYFEMRKRGEFEDEEYYHQVNGKLMRLKKNLSRIRK